MVAQGKDQIRLGEEAIAEAKNAQKLTEDRMNANLPGQTPTAKSCKASKQRRMARAGYLAAVRYYDQAQLRLLSVDRIWASKHARHNNSATIDRQARIESGRKS